MAIITNRNSLDQTVRIFDNFYSVKLQVNAGDYDVVYSYFAGQTKSAVIAANFTAMLFRIAQNGNYNVM